MTSPVLDALNKFLGMGFSLREACAMTDTALKMKQGTAKSVLVGRES